MSVNRESESILRAHLNWNILLTCPPMIIHAECARCPWRGWVVFTALPLVAMWIIEATDTCSIHIDCCGYRPTGGEWFPPPTAREEKQTFWKGKQKVACEYCSPPFSLAVSGFQWTKRLATKPFQRAEERKRATIFTFVFKNLISKQETFGHLSLLPTKLNMTARPEFYWFIACVSVYFFFRERNTLVLLKGKGKELENWT